MAILLHVLVAVLYAVTAWVRWPGGVAAERHPRAGATLLALALALHAIATARAIALPGGLDLSFVNALSLVAGLAVLAAWLTGVLRTLPRMAAVVLPVAAVCALLPPLAASPHRIAFAGDPWAEAHIAIALVAYALFVVVALQAVVMTGLEKRLHRARPEAAASATPASLPRRFAR